MSNRLLLPGTLPFLFALAACHVGADPDSVRQRTEFLYGPGSGRAFASARATPEQLPGPSAEDVLSEPRLETAMVRRADIHCGAS